MSATVAAAIATCVRELHAAADKARGYQLGQTGYYIDSAADGLGKDPAAWRAPVTTFFARWTHGRANDFRTRVPMTRWIYRDGATHEATPAERATTYKHARECYSLAADALDKLFNVLVDALYEPTNDAAREHVASQQAAA